MADLDPNVKPALPPLPGTAANKAKLPDSAAKTADAKAKAKATEPNNPDEPVEELAHITFWQKKWVQNILPVVTSLLLHVGIIVLAYATYKAVEQVVAVVKEQIIIPDAAIVENAPVGGIPNPGLGGDPNRPAAQDKYPDVSVTSEGFSSEPSEKLTQTLMGGGSGESEADSMIGIGANSSIGGKGRGTGSGSGDGTGSGTGEGGGPLAPFGVPGGGGGIGPKSPFMGISGNAKKVVYVCDATGSMMNVFARLKIELRKAIDILRPIQAFNVIFFQDEEVLTVSQEGLLMANANNKNRAYTFIEDTPYGGQTNPTNAIRLAFKQKPELMYVLTDGFDQVASYEAIVDEFRKLNADKLVKVNTILIAGENQQDRDPEMVKVLETISKENGGVMKIVSPDF